MAVKVANDMLSASWLAVRVAIAPFKLDAMRRAGELIAYRPPDAYEHYDPVRQFDEDWQPLPTIPRLVTEARARGLSDNRLYEILNARAGMGSRKRLGESLREGRVDHVLESIRVASS